MTGLRVRTAREAGSPSLAPDSGGCSSSGVGGLEQLGQRAADPHLATDDLGPLDVKPAEMLSDELQRATTVIEAVTSAIAAATSHADLP